VVSWQSIVARNVRPTDAAVITVGKLQSGTALNVISGEAEVAGTYRAFSDEVEALITRRMGEMAEQIAAAYGGRIEFAHWRGTSATVNDPARAAFMQEVAQEIVGSDQVIQIDPMMVGEDMAEFLQRVPGCFILVGASDPDGPLHAPHHNPHFDFDERMLPTGTALLAAAAWAYLERERNNA
jgi:amidohydrolase